MADYPAMPFWTDAYWADASHLSDAEHGVYLQLLIHAWRTPLCRLPADEKWVARKMKRSVEEYRETVLPILEEFWTCSGNYWTQKKQKKVRNDVEKLSKNQSARAKSRWDNKKNPCRENAGAMPDECPADAPECQPKPKPKPKPKHSTPQSPPRNGARLTVSDDAEFVAHKFLEAREEIWPNNPTPCNHKTELARQAQAWLDAGLEPYDITAKIDAGLYTLSDTGKSPPAAINFFRKSLDGALTAKRTAKDQQESATEPQGDPLASHPRFEEVQAVHERWKAVSDPTNPNRAMLGKQQEWEALRLEYFNLRDELEAPA